MSIDPRVKKIDGTYELTCEKRKKIRYYFATAMVMFGLVFVSVIVLTTSKTSGPIWTLPLESQVAELGLFISIILTMILFFKTPVLTFEKRIFMGLYNSYKSLARYNNLAGSSSQEHSDFDKSFESLKKVSLELTARTEKSRNTDMGTEINRMFCMLGELIQTRILPTLQKKNNLSQQEENVLQLADTFADISFNRIQSLTGTLEKLGKGDSVKLRSSFLESYPRLRSYFNHAYKLIGSIIVVFFVAFLFSVVFQKPISDFAVAIFAAIFVMFAAWEFRSNK